jgi:hypothetical protein
MSGLAAGDRLHEQSGDIRISPVAENETVSAMFNGAEGLAHRVHMLMVSLFSSVEWYHGTSIECLFSVERGGREGDKMMVQRALNAYLGSALAGFLTAFEGNFGRTSVYDLVPCRCALEWMIIEC